MSGLANASAPGSRFPRMVFHLAAACYGFMPVFSTPLWRDCILSRLSVKHYLTVIEDYLAVQLNGGILEHHINM